ncbi:unnamed protein product [Cochlearia groenlandica]
MGGTSWIIWLWFKRVVSMSWIPCLRLNFVYGNRGLIGLLLTFQGQVLGDLLREHLLKGLSDLSGNELLEVYSGRPWDMPCGGECEVVVVVVTDVWYLHNGSMGVMTEIGQRGGDGRGKKADVVATALASGGGITKE